MKNQRRKIITAAAYAIFAVGALSVLLIQKNSQLKEAEMLLRLASEKAESEYSLNAYSLNDALNEAAVLSDGRAKNTALLRVYAAACALESNEKSNGGTQAFLKKVKQAALSGIGETELLNYAEELAENGVCNFSTASAVQQKIEKEGITAEEAAEKAAVFLGIEAQKLLSEPPTNGSIPCYAFSYNDSIVFVSRAEGRIRLYLSNVAAGGSEIGSDEALLRASDFVEEHVFEDAKLIESSSSAGICSFAFAPLHGGVPCLTAKIRLSINLDSGKIGFFDGSEYLLCTCTQTAAKNVSEATAAKRISGKILSVSEVCKNGLCYRFEVQSPSKDKRYSVFVSAADGEVKAVEKISGF